MLIRRLAAIFMSSRSIRPFCACLFCHCFRGHANHLRKYYISASQSARPTNSRPTRRCTRPPTALRFARASLHFGLPAAGELSRWPVALNASFIKSRKRSQTRSISFEGVRSNSTVLMLFVLKKDSRLCFARGSNAWCGQSQRGSFACFLDARLARSLSLSGALLLRCPLRALFLLAFGCCKRGSCAIRFAWFSRLVLSVASAALAVSCVRDGFLLWSKSVRAQVQTLATGS